MVRPAFTVAPSNVRGDHTSCSASLVDRRRRAATGRRRGLLEGERDRNLPGDARGEQHEQQRHARPGHRLGPTVPVWVFGIGGTFGNEQGAEQRPGDGRVHERVDGVGELHVRDFRVHAPAGVAPGRASRKPRS